MGRPDSLVIVPPIGDGAEGFMSRLDYAVEKKQKSPGPVTDGAPVSGARYIPCGLGRNSDKGGENGLGWRVFWVSEDVIQSRTMGSLAFRKARVLSSRARPRLTCTSGRQPQPEHAVGVTSAVPGRFLRVAPGQRRVYGPQRSPKWPLVCTCLVWEGRTGTTAFGPRKGLYARIPRPNAACACFRWERTMMAAGSWCIGSAATPCFLTADLITRREDSS